MGFLSSVTGAVRRGAHNAFKGSPALGAADAVLATAGGGVAGGLAGGALGGEDGVGVGALGGMALGAPALGLGRLVMKIATELKAMHPQADNEQILEAAKKMVTSRASPTATGAGIGFAGGAMAPAENDDERTAHIMAGIGMGGFAGGLAGLKMRRYGDYAPRGGKGR